jgi:hydrogenase maturation protein HypF
MNNICRRYVVVTGIVQGVGFRPFVYNIAVDNGLKGWVKNTSEGVYVDIEGPQESVEIFLHKLTNEAPPLSKIDDIIIENRDVKNYTEFSIEKSDDNDRTITLISPDVATCKDCEKEIMNSKDRRYQYAFTNCTNCGPRFSIIKKLPYDRPMTTMEKFKMCPHCSEEYENPRDRRFHAEPSACATCGPRVYLTDRCGNEIATENPIEEVKNLIKSGKIIGIKGLGGLHIACDGKNKEVINRLRERKSRPSKPFALMMKDIDNVKQYCSVNEIEENTLKGIKRPILLLDVINNILPLNVAPDNNRLGVMLPYTPLHHLLFDDSIEVLVMTSANVSGLPIVYKNEEALEKLNNVVDYFLLNDRDIHVPVDDSVARVILGEERIIRRSRGYAPIPVIIEGIKETLAYGSHLKNTFCISKEQFAFMSQHMGDMDNLEAYKNYEYNVEHFKNLYNIKPELIAYDMHPDLLLSNFARKDEGKKIPVQHHHAHIVSCMIENKVNEKVIGIAFDGTGFGTDSKIWGGEFLVCDYKDFKRAGHLNYVKMAGGDSAVKQPWRMALGYLFKTYGDEVNTNIFTSISEKSIKTIFAMLKNNINSIENSSMGRFFDAVAALIGIKMNVTFEGEAAIHLETISHTNENGVYKFDIYTKDETYVVNTDNIIKNIIEDIEKSIDKSIIAKRFHNTVVAFSLEMCKLIRDKYGINSTALSGGVFQNEILLKGLHKRLIENGFKVYTHKDIPCNDGGISIGQLVIANYKEKNKEE